MCSSTEEITTSFIVLYLQSAQEIVVVIGGEVGLSAGLAAQGFTGADQLQVVQATGDAAIAVRVESVQRDAGTAIDAGVDFGPGEHRVQVRVHDARSRGGVRVDEVRACVGWIVRTLHIAIAQRRLDGSQGRDRAAVTLELRLALGVRSLDGSLDLGYGLGVALGDDQADAVLRSATVDGLGLPLLMPG